MSTLKNTYGFSSDLLNTVKKINEKKLHSNQKQLDKNKNDKIDAEDFEILRGEKPVKEETNLNESDYKIGDNVICKSSGMKGKVTKLDKPEKGKYYTVKREDGKIMKYAPDELKLMKEDMKEEIKLNEVTLNQGMISFLTQLLAVLKNLVPASTLRKMTKEELEILELFGDVEVEDLEEALEGMTKKKRGRPPKVKTDTTIKKSDDDEEDEGPAYSPASGKDEPHIMNQLAGAADTGGRHIKTAKGYRYVSGDTAKKLHGALQRMKPEDRAKASTALYQKSHSSIEKDHEESLKRGVEVPKEKRGRGRPKKVQP